MEPRLYMSSVIFDQEDAIHEMPDLRLTVKLVCLLSKQMHSSLQPHCTTKCL